MLRDKAGGRAAGAAAATAPLPAPLGPGCAAQRGWRAGEQPRSGTAEPPAPAGQSGPVAMLCAAAADPRRGSQTGGGGGGGGGAVLAAAARPRWAPGRGVRSSPGGGDPPSAGPEARGRSRGAEPGVLQALGGGGAALGRVLQRGQEEAGERRNLPLCPAVSVGQDAVEAAGGEPGDPQESAWQRQRKRSVVITTPHLDSSPGACRGVPPWPCAYRSL